jgi:chromosomal replication initiation ATPase DnaA
MKKTIFDKYVKEVCELYRIRERDLWEKTKKLDIVNARYLLYYLCHIRNIAQVDIISYCEECGYSVARPNLIHAIKSIGKKVATDSDYYNIVKRIEESVSI